MEFDALRYSIRGVENRTHNKRAKVSELSKARISLNCSIHVGRNRKSISSNKDRSERSLRNNYLLEHTKREQNRSDAT